MKTLRFLMILLAVGLTSCRKVPYSEFFHALMSSAEQQSASAQAAPMPDPVAESPAAPSVDRSAQVIVLGYHRLVDKVRHPDTEITPAEFEAQMQTLKDQGITVISLEDFMAWRREEKSIPTRSALITIDDGYNVAYRVAWPILKKFGYPFTMFIYTDYVLGGPKSGGGSMTWAQLAEMRDAGVAIQSHTVSHPDLRRKKGGAPEASYDDWLWHELHGSKSALEQQLGIEVKALALPFGLANDHVREAAARAGYEMLFTVNGQKIGFATPMNSLPRYMVQANQPKLFATMTTFEGGGGASGPATTTVALANLRPLPTEDAVIGDPDPLIQADLSSLDLIDPGSVSVRISGLGEVTARFDPETKVVTYQAHGLLPNKYTVIIAAKSKGKKFESRWSFTIVPPVGAPPIAVSAPR
jgi:peptidoglycan/xylan/chitin deacetylase (PgdA/CDA1 family)